VIKNLDGSLVLVLKTSELALSSVFTQLDKLLTDNKIDSDRILGAGDIDSTRRFHRHVTANYSPGHDIIICVPRLSLAPTAFSLRFKLSGIPDFERRIEIPLLGLVHNHHEDSGEAVKGDFHLICALDDRVPERILVRGDGQSPAVNAYFRQADVDRESTANAVQGLMDDLHAAIAGEAAPRVSSTPLPKFLLHTTFKGETFPEGSTSGLLFMADRSTKKASPPKRSRVEDQTTKQSQASPDQDSSVHIQVIAHLLEEKEKLENENKSILRKLKQLDELGAYQGDDDRWCFPRFIEQTDVERAKAMVSFLKRCEKKGGTFYDKVKRDVLNLGE
jgi:hypothetical protein